MLKMQENGWLGAKSGQGFFLKKKDKDGSTIYELNPETFEYEDRKKLKTAATEMAKQAKGSRNKLKALVSAQGDKAGDLVWSVVKPVLIYSAELLGEIADDIVSIDEAMRWGFGWELGPFEIWDAIGLEKSVERMRAEGETIPSWILEHLDAGNKSFYKSENNETFYYTDGHYEILAQNEKNIDLKHVKEVNGVIKRNAGASLIDIGDGVALLE